MGAIRSMRVPRMVTIMAGPSPCRGQYNDWQVALGLKDLCSPNVRFRGKSGQTYGGSLATGQSTREKNGADNNRYDDKGIALSCDYDEEHDHARGHK
jgi:hypothetical protein